jgi:hypothetical protein
MRPAEARLRLTRRIEGRTPLAADGFTSLVANVHHTKFHMFPAEHWPCLAGRVEGRLTLTAARLTTLPRSIASLHVLSLPLHSTIA